MKIYLVGGAVRDILMGQEPRDRDYVVVGSTEYQMLELGFKKVSASFPVFLHPETGEEYALARKEKKTAAGYKGFDIYSGSEITLEQDLIRRDLTINSMAMDESGNVIDPFGGQNDIKNKLIRHTSDAFSEDPIRILRACRFAARYNFSIDPSTVELMTENVNRGELHHVTKERIFLEIHKGLGEKYWIKMLKGMKLCGASDVIRPFHYGFDNLKRIRDPKRKDMLNEISDFDLKLALATFGFRHMSRKDCINWGFPNHESHVISTVNYAIPKFLEQQSYSNMNPRERVDFISSHGLINDEQMLNLLIALYDIFYYDNIYCTGSKELRDDVTALKNINYEKVVIAGKAEGLNPKTAVANARVFALTFINKLSKN